MDQEQTEFLRAELCILDTASLGHGPVQMVTRPRAGDGGHAEAPWCDDKIDILVSLHLNWLHRASMLPRPRIGCWDTPNEHTAGWL